MASHDLTAEPEYQVALSFAGEQREFVKAVASELNKHGVKVFYDEENKVKLWGKNLVEEFQRIYMTDSHVVVMFISKEYADKPWTRHERRSALTQALRLRREYILPFRFDDTVLEGLDPDMSYLEEKDFSPQQLAEAILTKLVELGGRVESRKPAFRVKDASDDDRNVCRVIVHDEQGVPVESATVLLVASNGTANQAKTGSGGVAELPAKVRRAVAVFVAHPGHHAAFHRQHDIREDLEVELPAGAGVGSVILASSTGHIPGFGPRLNPHGSSHATDGSRERGAMYLDNGSVDGQVQQPFRFAVAQSMMLEDSHGKQVRATCVGFVGRSTLWEYEYPDT